MAAPKNAELKQIYQTLFDLHEFVVDVMHIENLSGQERQTATSDFAERFRKSIRSVSDRLVELEARDE